jgi:2-haloacid dehalogenase
MFMSRRKFAALAAGGALAAAAPADHGLAADRVKMKIKAVAFDGFPIIDPRPVFARLEEIFSGKGR